MPPPVAVIIPTYNRATLLVRAISSVFGQTFRDFELVAVDDGSTDGTCDLPVFKDKDPRIHYLRFPENRGVSAARNAGVRATGAPWLAFLDSDDEWFPSKLEKQMKWIEQNKEFLICQTQELWIRRGVRVNPPKSHEKLSGDLFAASLDRCMITPSSVMLSRELFERSGGFDESLPACEDYDLWLRITCSNPVGLLDEPLLRRYGGHPDQLSALLPALDRYRVQSLLKLLQSGVLSDHQKNLAIAALVKRTAILSEGSRKRGNTNEYERYREIIGRYGGIECSAGPAAFL